VGDFIVAAGLIKDIITCLKDAGGSASEYQELMLELHGLQLSLNKIEHLKGTDNQIENINNVKVAALHCKFALDSFLKKLKGYDNLDLEKGRGFTRDSIKKVK
jgi:hypothetical protein